jgi:hypothetical protein
MPRPPFERRCIAAQMRRDRSFHRTYVRCIYARDREHDPLCARHGTRKDAGFAVLVLPEDQLEGSEVSVLAPLTKPDEHAERSA